ncbi:hypothetical protein C8Q80DRAFT_321383 [Daedaleopsis nitida]|nr:hypothetical protein C8Q80DRAFT_321383 [Daedaleopsis nitida]
MYDIASTSTNARPVPQSHPRLRQRLKNAAYDILRAYFDNTTHHPTAEQCNELAAQVRQLVGCESCTPEQVRKYFEWKRGTYAKGRENVSSAQDASAAHGRVVVEVETNLKTGVVPKTALSLEAQEQGPVKGRPTEGGRGVKHRKYDRLGKDAYKVLDDFFTTVTQYPTTEQCQDLFEKVQHLPGCEQCTLKKVRRYFARKRIHASQIKLGAHVDEDSKHDAIILEPDIDASPSTSTTTSISANAFTKTNTSQPSTTTATNENLARNAAPSRVEPYTFVYDKTMRLLTPVALQTQRKVMFVAGNPRPAHPPAEQQPPAPLSRKCKQELIEPPLSPFSEPLTAMVDQLETTERPSEGLMCKEMHTDPAPSRRPTRPVLASISTQATTPSPIMDPGILDLAAALRKVLKQAPQAAPDRGPRTFAELSRWCVGGGALGGWQSGIGQTSEARGRLEEDADDRL